MKHEDFDAFGVFMSMLQETFSPDKPISKERTKIYFEILSDISIESLELAIKDLMKTRQYPTFPLPREIREAAGFNLDDHIELRALGAFRQACELVYPARDPGHKIEAEDLLIEKTIYLCFGGWDHFADTDPKDETWDRKHFVEIYKNLFQLGKKDELLSQAEIMKQLKENREDMKTLEEKK